VRVEYSGSGWTEARVAKWGEDVEVARNLAPEICSRVRSILGRPVTSVLEIGCGSGFMGVGFESADRTYTGVDVDRESIEFARAKGINAHCISAEQLADSELRDRQYDLVLSSNVFEHVGNPMSAFVSARRVCQGALVLIVPNALGLYQRLRAAPWVRRLAQAVLGNTRDIAYSIDGHWHNIAYTSRTLDYLCRHSGFVPIRCGTMSINDPLFGFVQRNSTWQYRAASAIAGLVRMDSELLLVARPRLVE